MANIKMSPLLSVFLLYLVIFGASLPLTAEPPEGGTINDAIRREDVAAVKLFVQGGEDLNPNPEVTDPPLAAAVRQGNMEIIRLLLDNGANSNLYLNEGPFTATPILFLVLDRDDKALVDLFMERGVNRGDFNGYILASLSSGQHLNMARLILDRGLARIDSSLPFLLRYAVGTPEARALIAGHSREIAEGKANLLDEMLRNKGLLIDYSQRDPDLKLPLATAILGDKNDPFRYSAEKAFDGDAETSWVEGVKGDGIGQKIAFSPSSEFKESDIGSIAVLPGYGAEKYFHRNNRVKQAILSVYPWGGMASQMNLSFGIGDRIYQTTLAFEDRMALQSFPLKIPDFEKDMVLSAMIFVLEITQVYPGSEWQDTCVAEIELRDRNGRKIPVLP